MTWLSKLRRLSAVDLGTYPNASPSVHLYISTLVFRDTASLHPLFTRTTSCAITLTYPVKLIAQGWQVRSTRRHLPASRSDAKMQDPSPPPARGEYRQLRAVTMISFLFGFALLVPYWDGSGRAVPSIGIFPLFFSAVSGALIVTGRLQLAGKIALIDSLLVMAYIAILVPR